MSSFYLVQLMTTIWQVWPLIGWLAFSVNVANMWCCNRNPKRLGIKIDSHLDYRNDDVGHCALTPTKFVGGVSHPPQLILGSILSQEICEPKRDVQCRWSDHYYNGQ